MAFWEGKKGKPTESKAESISGTQEQRFRDLSRRLEAFKPRSAEQLPEADKALARSIGNQINQSVQDLPARSQPLPDTPADTSGTSAPLRQNAFNQDRSAFAQSPTTLNVGNTKETAPAVKQEEPAKAQLPSKPKSLVWER